MELVTIALFGEAEHGALCRPTLCVSLHDLLLSFGLPPKDSQGIYYAVQALLYRRHVLFSRVASEGFSTEDYTIGLRLLMQTHVKSPITALFMPGVGSEAILSLGATLCKQSGSALMITEADFFDAITEQAA